MPYFAPYVDKTGLHIPTYADIRDNLIAKAQSIYGPDLYLENDSQDYQFISVFSLMMNDALQAVQLAYNNRGPASAIGAGLDGVVKLNGVARKTPSYSSCSVILSGEPGAVINNGVVGDSSGNNWSLAPTLTIGADGTLTTTAVCQTIGAVTALPGDINQIVTPTYGWTGVINEVAAVVGQPVETDSQLKARQAISTQLPSQTLLEGTKAGIASVSGVSRCEVYENDTNTADENGLPPHSITAVVEGGADTDIAKQIYARKGIGGYTNGTTEVDIIDPYGLTTAIRFYRPTYVPIYATLQVHQLPGYTEAITDSIKSAITDYLNGLQIGENLTISALWAVALSVMPDLKSPVFSLRSVVAGKTSGSQTTEDIELAFNEVSEGLTANIMIEPV